MKVLVTGAAGQLGSEVIKLLRKKNIECYGAVRNDFDLLNKEKTKSFISEYNPSAIVHCAAYTDVDRAEIEPNLCYRINFEATKNIAETAKALEAKMMYISSDYVFNGRGEKPFEVDDRAEPLNHYGKSKYQGEKITKKLLNEYFILRTAWLYGISGNNFIKTMLKLAEKNTEISVVDDQISSPTYCTDLAELILEIIDTEYYGTYHGVNEGYCSWYEFAAAIFNYYNLSIHLQAVKSSEFKRKAERPKNSRLSTASLNKNFNKLPSYKDSLRLYLELYKNEIGRHYD
jgi:dTDP-4-dehydrorhamnose reductase